MKNELHVLISVVKRLWRQDSRSWSEWM